MSRKVLCLALCAMLFALCSPPRRSSRQRSLRLGSSSASGCQSTGASEGIRRVLRELGYVEGKNIAFEYRYAEGKLDRIPALADELVRLKVDVLVASSTAEALAFKNATKTIPIVFVSSRVILLRMGWLIAWRAREETSRGSLPFRRCWPANGWSCSRKPFPSSPALRCCGTHRIQALSTMERKPTAGARIGSAASFPGGQQCR